MNEAYTRYLKEERLKEIAAKIDRKMRFGVQKARETEFIPYTTAGGTWAPQKINGWTNGFWAASMWQMYLQTGEEIYREEAVRAETMMDAALKDFQVLHHDVGFMWLIQSGVRYALEGNRDSFDRTMLAADLLASRFNPNGFIRAWNGEDRVGTAIIDTMMNLSLLYWASRQTGDPRFRLIAMHHADTAMKYFVREDGSCNHIVRFDPETGAYIDNPAGQGFASGSSWSRGQSWALYGFTLSYLNTGKPEYLDTAVKVAEYVIPRCEMAGWIPPCDYRQPEGLDLQDNAAGAVTACGLMELAELVPPEQGERYRAAACNLLTAMTETCCDWGEDEPGILTRCTVSYAKQEGHHIRMNYADYFLIEAMGKVKSRNPILFWAPDVKK